MLGKTIKISKIRRYTHKKKFLSYKFLKSFLIFISLLCIKTKSFAEYTANIEYTKNFGGSSNDYFRSVTSTSDNGIVLVGETLSTDINNLSNNGKSDAIIMKFDSSGEKMWQKSFGGSNADYFKSVIETSDKGIVTVGYTYSIDIENLNPLSTESYLDAIIVKYDKDGNQLWTKNFGGSKSDWFHCVIETSDKGIIAVGNSTSDDIEGLSTLSSSNYYDAIIVKYNSKGEQIWVKNFGGLSNDYFKSITETTTNGFVAVGYSSSTNAGFTNKGNIDSIIVKYDSQGNQEWVRNFGGSGNDYLESVVKTSDGSIVAVGYSESTDIENLTPLSTGDYPDAIIIKYDNNGNQFWIKNFGGSNYDYFYSVIETSDKEILVVGETYSTVSGITRKGGYDAIIIKYDNDGSQLWVKNFGGSNHDYFRSITETNNKRIFVAGYSNSTDIPNLTSLSTTSYSDAIVVKYKLVTAQEKAVKIALSEPLLNNIKNARALVNELEESIEKDLLQEQLNSLYAVEMEIEPLTAAANMDMYVKFKNTLSLSLSTSSITFDDFSGVEDLTMDNALSLTVSSSLDYDISSSLVGNIVSSKGNVLDKSIFNLKANGDTSYKNYSSSNTLSLFTNQTAGNNQTHKIDMMLKGNVAHTADVYKAVLKIMVEQV
jgi:hypothetical protein